MEHVSQSESMHLVSGTWQLTSRSRTGSKSVSSMYPATVTKGSRAWLQLARLVHSEYQEVLLRREENRSKKVHNDEERYM
jgi:hypothetical protein